MSVIPLSRIEQKCQLDNLSFQVANRTSIATYGRRSLSLNLGLRSTFRWVFVVVDIQNPILGVDFLRNYSLLVDVLRKQLLDALTHFTVQGVASLDPSPISTFLSKHLAADFEAILTEFLNVSKPCNFDHATKHDMTHHITTPGPPVYARHRRLAPD